MILKAFHAVRQKVIDILWMFPTLRKMILQMFPTQDNWKSSNTGFTHDGRLEIILWMFPILDDSRDIFIYTSLPCHLDWPRLSYREQSREGEEEADTGNDGETTSKSGLALNGIYYYGKPRTARSGGSWL